MEGSNKIKAGLGSFPKELQHLNNVEIGQVVSVTDEEGLDRIKVFINGPTIHGGDNGVNLSDLAWCYPMVPKFFSSKPKVGESVFVFKLNNESKHSVRLYIGPIISQLQKLNFDSKSGEALTPFDFGTYTPNINVNRIPELTGVFPDPNDISIQGRLNNDIILKDNETILRVGKFTPSLPTTNNPYSFQFNTLTQGYIQLKNDVIVNKNETTDEQERGTVTNIVSNKINLLTHKEGSPRFNLTNQQDLISTSELDRILKEAHPLAFGDVMIEYLRLLKNAFLNHVHNGTGRQPTDLTTDGNTQFVKEFTKNADLLEQQMLSKNVRIN